MSINISLHVSVFHEKTRCSVGWACVAHLSFCFVETLYRTFQGASYQVSVHLAKRFQRRRFFRNQPIRNKNCLWRPCLLTDRDKMSNLYRGPSIDASYQVSEEKIKMWKVNGRRTTDAGRQVMAKAHIAFGKVS
jgi:hypothetical protein